MMAGSSSLQTGLGTGDALARWDVVALLEISNFTLLRRYLGGGRADHLADDCVARIVALLPQAVARPVGRALVEIVATLPGRDEVDALLVGLAACFDAPLDCDGEWQAVATRVGAATAPHQIRDEIALVEGAEAALAEARGSGRTVLRDLTRNADAPPVDELIRDLRTAIRRDELFLHYQPKAHLRRRQVVSLEALVRWQHPGRGLILPGAFIPAAEQAGEIEALTLWTLDAVIAEQRALARDGYDLPIFLNMSGQLLADSSFVATATRKVRDGGARIGLEITETSVIRDPDSAIRHLKTFADEGISIAIDDYGAGLSSLAYLKQLPASELKIDKMFITQLSSSHRDPLIVRSTIDLAHALEMEVTAEGVEMPAALALLTVMGCDMAQGYLISRPISPVLIRQLLADDPMKDVASPGDLLLAPVNRAARG
jgi:EAL domain-containing protein (putative c-di-GMP-specific phosphodiesterase class I)